METMKAVQIHEFGGPEVLKYEDVPRPELGPGEVLVRVCDAGVNPVDFKMRQGGRYQPPLPAILGRDLCGVVEAVGPNISHLKEGDQVYGLAERGGGGSYAEYIKVTESDVALKPKSIDCTHAAAIPLASMVAWQALFDIAHLSAGQTVLIHGAAGGVGHIAVQLAKWKGARVIGTATGDQIEFVRKLGADEVIDFRKERFEEKLHDVDVVLDLIGGDTQERSWQVLKKGGILVSSVGIQSPEAAAQHGVRAEGVVARNDSGELAQIADLVDKEVIEPMVEAVMPLSEAAKAHELLQQGQAKGKIILQVSC